MIFNKTNKKNKNTASPDLTISKDEASDSAAVTPPGQVNLTPGQSGGSAQPVIFDVGMDNFETQVLKASQDIPVIVDFWAPWCGPCKQLTPALEDEVRAAGGKVRLAKINIDDNPELAQALKVQSVPAVFAFFRGQPVTGFTGAKPRSQIQSLIRQLTQLAQQSRPDALNIEDVLTEAAEALAAGNIEQAHRLYVAVLDQDPVNGRAFAGLVRCFIATGDLSKARGLIDNAPDEIKTDPLFAEARTALDLAEDTPDGDLDALEATVEADPDNLQARYDLSKALFASNRRADAIDHLIEIIQRDKEWNDEQARKQLLKYFEAMGPADPDTVAGRRKLSSLLFS